MITEIGGESETASAVVVQLDGKIIAAGQADVHGDGGDFALVRYQ